MNVKLNKLDTVFILPIQLPTLSRRIVKESWSVRRGKMCPSERAVSKLSAVQLF